MKPVVVVEMKIPFEILFELLHVLIVVQVDPFILDTAPQPLDGNVVGGSADTVHGDLDTMVFEGLCVDVAGVLASLVGIEDFRLRVACQCIREYLHHKVGIHRVGDVPAQHRFGV